VGHQDSVVVMGRRSAHAVSSTWGSSRDWTVAQLSFFRRWPYGLQLYDLYSAVRRGQWPSINPGAPRRNAGRRVALREVRSGRYVRLMSRREGETNRRHSHWQTGWDGRVEALERELLVDASVPWLHGGVFEVFDATGGGDDFTARAALGPLDAKWELLSRAEDSEGFVAVGWRPAFFEHIGGSLGPNASFDWCAPLARAPS